MVRRKRKPHHYPLVQHLNHEQIDREQWPWLLACQARALQELCLADPTLWHSQLEPVRWLDDPFWRHKETQRKTWLTRPL